MLAGVLVVNMLLLVPRLHANAPSSSSSSDDDDDSSIGLQLKGLSAAAPPPAATAAHVSTAKGGGQARRQQQQQQQQRRQQRSGEPPTGEFMHDFDANKDGVLGPAEFQTLMQASVWRTSTSFLQGEEAHGAEGKQCVVYRKSQWAAGCDNHHPKPAAATTGTKGLSLTHVAHTLHCSDAGHRMLLVCLLLQEACRNDRSALGMFSWLARLMRLGVGLRPQYAPAGGFRVEGMMDSLGREGGRQFAWRCCATAHVLCYAVLAVSRKPFAACQQPVVTIHSLAHALLVPHGVVSTLSGPYPCSLRSDLADATRQAAVALSFSTGRSSRQGGTSSSSSSQGRGSRGLRDELRADTAAGAAAVDPDSPGGYV